MKTKICVYGILILIIALLFVYIWKSMEVKKAEKNIQEERNELTQKAQEMFDSKTESLLRLSILPMSWLIQNEMIKENYNAIDNYFNQLVREKNLKLILLAKEDGKILVSTDKSLEKKDITSVLPREFMDKPGLEFSEDLEGNLRLTIPIVYLNERIGLLLMVYTREKITF